MTKNNLEDHLSWLLKTRPFIPPGAWLSPLPVKSRPNPGGSQETLDQSIQTRPPREIDSAIKSPIIGTPGRTSVVKGFARPSLPQKLPVQGHSIHTGTPKEPCDGGAMARLQSAPKSPSKPRLLTQPSAARTPREHTAQHQVTAATSTTTTTTNASASLRDRYSAHCRRVGESQDTPSTGRTPKASHFGEQSVRQHPTEAITPSVSRTEICPPTMESIDLTGDDDVQTSSSGTVEVFGRPRTIWREDSASREEPLLKKGKKRKSDEYDADCMPRTPKSGTKRGRIEVDARLHSSPKTPTIDTFPDEAPPPYSATSHPPQSQRSKYSVEDHSQPALGDDDYEEHVVTETRTRTEMRRKRKPVGRVSSGSGEALDLQDREKITDKVEQAAAPGYPKRPVMTGPKSPASEVSKSSHAPKLVRRQTIPNSDEEEEEEEEEKEYGMKSDFWDDIGKYDSDAGGRRNHSDAKQRDSPTQVKQVGSSGGLRARGIGSSTSKNYENKKHSFASGVAIPDQGEKNSQASPFQCDSPTKFAKCAEGKTNNAKLHQAVMMVMRQVLAQPISETKEFQQRLQEFLEGKKQQAIRYLREGGNPPATLTEERRLLKKQSEGVAEIISLKVEYLKLTDLQHELGDKLLEAYDEGYDLSELQKELNKACLSLEQKEAEIAAVFQDADLVSVFDDEASRLHPGKPNGYVETQPEVIVRSTQAPGESSRKTTMAQSSGLSPTQVVKQTQVTQTWTTPVTPFKTPIIEKLNSRQQMPVSGTIPSSKFGESTSRAFLRASTPPPNPTEIATYFSPKRNSELKAVKNSIGSVQTNSGVDWLKRSSPSSRRLDPPQQIERQRDVGTDVTTHASRNLGGHVGNWIEEECDGYSKTTAAADNDDEQYGSENDEDLLEAEIGLKFDRSRSKNREVFAETSGNLVSHSKCGAPPISTAPPSSMQHRWSNDVKAAMKDRFHLRGFRQNQLQAINATLAGKDAFVLMPTGGGKSLCYQLPSIINSGKTRGVTVVISPLLSLMQDQVDHLRKLNIQAFLYNGEVTAEHRKLVMQGLWDPNVEQLIQLLYVTPEMVTKNQALVNAFLALHDRQKLARIVIDEAHCVSQWGHDFRPDYKAIGEVRRQFRGVPVMALTATATENVKVDVIHNLSIEGCEIFTQSFNRPNLTYEIRAKTKDKEVLDSIANTIRGSYMGQSGIIYCLSRQNCEKLAEKLRQQYGIKAHHYHAGMEAVQKIFVQKEWQAGRYNVIVATIAFGMGIDKPDVRFVIHHTIPKSLEGYYQETGRAGRDGKRSGCYLYYGYRDTSALKRMIDDGDGSWEQKDRQHKMLRNVVHFCENRVDCRRVQVLAYFNEPFLSENCNNGCDNCTSSSVFENRDLTEYAVHAVNLVKRLQGENVTLLHCVDVFRGSKTKKIIDADHVSLAEYGSGSNLERGDAERLFYRLLSEDALTEHNIVNKSGFASQYVRLGRNYREFVSGRRKLKIQVRVSPKAKDKIAPKQAKKGTGVVGAMRPKLPQSTNISSPVQQATRRRKAREDRHDSDLPLHDSGYLHDDFVVPDDECSPDLDDFDDTEAFEPIRVKGIATKASKQALSAPIRTDQEMAALNPIHRDIVESFLIHAKKEAEEIRNAKNLRAQPFSDNILRRMAINFPKDEDEMLQIQGIEPDKVRRYGKKFLKLIKNHHDHYQSIMANNEDIRFDKPVDPNLDNFIIISDEEDRDSVDETSRFFTDPEVEAFNSQFAHCAIPPAPPSRSNFTSRDRESRGGAREKFRGNAGARKKSGRHPSRAGSLAAKPKSGIQKKSASNSGKRTGSGNWSHASGFPARSGGPPKRGDGGGTRGIGMMPI